MLFRCLCALLVVIVAVEAQTMYSFPPGIEFVNVPLASVTSNDSSRPNNVSVYYRKGKGDGPSLARNDVLLSAGNKPILIWFSSEISKGKVSAWVSDTNKEPPNCEHVDAQLTCTAWKRTGMGPLPAAGTSWFQSCTGPDNYSAEWTVVISGGRLVSYAYAADNRLFTATPVLARNTPPTSSILTHCTSPAL